MTDDELPAELPEKPKGWTRNLALHMNFGRAGGAATYEVYDDLGRKMPFIYQYDTRKDGLTGFTLLGIEGVMSWAQLRARWPEYLKSRKDDDRPGA